MMNDSDKINEGKPEELSAESFCRKYFITPIRNLEDELKLPHHTVIIHNLDFLIQ